MAYAPEFQVDTKPYRCVPTKDTDQFCASLRKAELQFPLNADEVS